MFETEAEQRDRNSIMKKEKEDYQTLIQMLRDFKIDEKEAIGIILSRLRSGRPKSSFKPIICKDILNLMNRRKLKKKSSIQVYLNGAKFKYKHIKKLHP